MKRPKLLLCILLMLPFWAAAWNVDSLKQKALDAYEAGDLGACISYAGQSAEIAGKRTGERASEQASALAAEYWEKPVLDIGRKIRNTEPAEGVRYFQYFLGVSISNFGAGHSTSGKLYAFIGECFLRQDRFFRAAENFEAAISILEKTDGESNFYKLILQKTGNLYSRLGNNAKAIEYLERCASIAAKTNDEIRSAKVSCDINYIYVNQNKFANVKESTSQRLNNENFPTRYAITLQLYRSKANLELGFLEEAESEIRTTLKQLNDFPELKDERAFLYASLGKVFLKKGDLQQSRDFYTKALESGASAGRESANIYRQRGQALVQFDSLEAGLKDLQHALAYYAAEPELRNSFENPSAENLSRDPQLILTLKVKGNALEKMGMDSMANATYQLAFKVANLSQLAYLHENSKLDMGEHLYPICVSAVQLNLRLSESGSGSDLFKAIEANKGSTLKAFKQQSAALANIPEKILQQQQLTKEDILDLEGKQKNTNSDSIAARIFELKRSLDTLHLFLEKRYNAYARTMVASQIELEELRQQLDSRSCFLTYFSGEENFYAMGIWADKHFAYSFPIEKLTALKPEEAFLYSKNSADKAETDGRRQEMYRLLIQPLVQQLPESIDKLTISPDGSLHRVPFAALLDENNHLLLDRFTISYAVSATIRYAKRPENTPAAQLAALAPFAKQAPANLQPLPYTERELDGIAKFSSPKRHIGSAANDEALKLAAEKFSLLHLATHADVNTKDPLQSGLWLAGAGGMAKKFRVPEIYNLQTTAELVVLSACNTGVGKIRSGEGVLSLARAFNRAGAQSTLLSLWAVDDASTAQLMEHFYEGLKNGLPKDEALQQAQQRFLETADPLHAHPWFWSGFILSGDTRPVQFQASIQPLYMYGLPLLGLLLLLTLWLLMRRQKAA